jgi:hypothetical protein
MRFLKINTLVLSLISVSPVHGQTEIGSWPIRDRAIGPIERSLYSLRGAYSLLAASDPGAALQDTIIFGQPLITDPIIGGAFGASLGILAGAGIGYFIVEGPPDYGHMISMSAAIACMEPMGLAMGVHGANNKLGNPGLVGLTSYGSLAGGLLLTGGRKGLMGGVLLVQLAATVVVERLTAAARLRRGWSKDR